MDRLSNGGGALGRLKLPSSLLLLLPPPLLLLSWDVVVAGLLLLILGCFMALWVFGGVALGEWPLPLLTDELEEEPEEWGGASRLGEAMYLIMKSSFRRRRGSENK